MLSCVRCHSMLDTLRAYPHTVIMSVKIQIPDAETFAMRFSQHALTATLVYMKKLEGQYGEDFTKIFLRQYVSGLVANVMFKSLNTDLSGVPQKLQPDIAMENFADIKMQVQDAVAVGVQTAMTQFWGKPCEYFCQIKPMPEVINKKPC